MARRVLVSSISAFNCDVAPVETRARFTKVTVLSDRSGLGIYTAVHLVYIVHCNSVGRIATLLWPWCGAVDLFYTIISFVDTRHLLSKLDTLKNRSSSP